MGNIIDALSKFTGKEFTNGLISVNIKYHNSVKDLKYVIKKNNLTDGEVNVIFNLNTRPDYKDAIEKYFEDYCGDRGCLYRDIEVSSVTIKPIKWTDIEIPDNDGRKDKGENL